MLATFVQDALFAVRIIRRQLMAAIAAIMCIAIGIGATTTMFSVADALLVRPLPYPAGDRLVVVGSSRQGDQQSNASYLDFLDWRDRQRSFTSLAALGFEDFTIQGTEAERVPGALASANLFATLGATAEAGRLFSPDEDRPGAPPVILVSRGFAERHFGSVRQAVGGTIIVDGNTRDIVGIIPDRWRYPSRAELWVPLGRDPLDGRRKRGSRNLSVLGALRPGVTVAQARAEMQQMSAQLAREYPDDDGPYTTGVVPLRDSIVGNATRSLAALTLAAVLVLLVACANVASLQLARATARSREIAVRAAIGAGRARLVRQLLTESVLLAVVGGAVGCLLAAWSVGFVSRAIVSAHPAWMVFDVDRRALLFSFVAASLTGIAFGLGPAVRLVRLRPALALRGAEMSGRGNRAQRALVSVEIMLAVALSAGAVLAVQSIREVQHIPLGFDPAGVLTARLSLEPDQYDAAARARMVDAIESRLAALSGVLAVGAASLTPVDGCCSQFSVRIEGDPSEHGGQAQQPMITGTIVTPGYFQAMGIPLTSGRVFTAHDTKDAPRVVVVNETFARRYWPDGSALGRHVDTGIGNAEVVGIVRDIRQTSLLDTPEPQFYRPYAQSPWTFMTVAVRSRSTDAAALVPEVRRVIQDVDRAVPVYNARTMSDVVRAARSSNLVFGQLLAGFAVVALLLAAMGVYAVMSFFVGERRRELGLRMALGAGQTDLVRFVIAQSSALSLAGVGAGVVIALGGARLLASVLYGVTAMQPLALVVAGGAFLVVAVAATYGPARRASAADPMVALRTE